MEQKLGMYCGLILYMIEMDEDRYQKLCTVGRLGTASSRSIGANIIAIHRATSVPLPNFTAKKSRVSSSLCRTSSRKRVMTTRTRVVCEGSARALLG